MPVAILPAYQIVGRGVDTLVLNVCSADGNDKPVKQELAADLQAHLSHLQEEARTLESAVLTPWSFKGFSLYMQPKGSRGQWKWILTCPLISLAVSRGLLSPITAQVRLSSEYLWSCETIWNAIVETLFLLYTVFYAKFSQVDALSMHHSTKEKRARLRGWRNARKRGSKG